jgi:hypothetical protein
MVHGGRRHRYRRAYYWQFRNGIVALPDPVEESPRIPLR